MGSTRTDGPTSTTWSRRHLLAGTTVGLGATALTGCDLFATDPAQSGSEGDGPDADLLEAPELAERVEHGDLPPLEERLPDNPLVLEPVDSVGTYGGTWNTAMLGPADDQWLYRTIGYDQLLTWGYDFTEPLENLAESVDTSDDGREYVIHLRTGVKWSDGEEFTADDVMFYHEAVASNETLSPTPPAWLTAAEELAEFEKVDDHTVRVRFTEPSVFFPTSLARPDGEVLTAHPRHYLERFHPEYSSDVDGVVESEGHNDWVELFEAKTDRWQNADMPTLSAWRLVTPLGEGPRVVAERNPYYWKVDPGGRQLPYIDRVVHDVVEDEEVMLLQTTSGEIDFTTRHINTPTNKPVLARSRDESDYQLFDMVPALVNQMVVALNLTHENPVKREIFQNKNFRIGLSHAINRREVIDTSFQRQGQPWQVAPRPESEFYDEEMGTQYTEYDVDLANQYLNDAGYDERDADGIRLGPDGEPIVIHINIPTEAAMGARPEDVELIERYWTEVGVDVQVHSMDRSLWTERWTANDFDAQVVALAGGLTDGIFQPQMYFPENIGCTFAIPWANWYTGEEEPREEPPSAPKRQMELYDQLRATVDADERADLFTQILEITKEEFYLIGVVMPDADYGVAKSNLRNVHTPMIESFQYVTPGPTNPAQYYIAT